MDGNTLFTLFMLFLLFLQFYVVFRVIMWLSKKLG